MKKKFIPLFLLLTGLLLVYSCRKEIKATQICLHDSSIDYLKRWANVFIQTDTYNANGTLQSRTFVYPHGYFQINSDFTYNLYSDDAPVNGNWNINNSCQFVLNPHTITERLFSVIQLSNDSLTISQTMGNTNIIQHYASFTCPSLASLAYRWDDIFTRQTTYNATNVSAGNYTYPAGYLRLNANASYVLLNNDQPAQNGTWGIIQPGCLLVLDKNTVNQQLYDVQKLTDDSLVIWRKDTVAKVNYLQHYLKHK